MIVRAWRCATHGEQVTKDLDPQGTARCLLCGEPLLPAMTDPRENHRDDPRRAKPPRESRPL